MRKIYLGLLFSSFCLLLTCQAEQSSETKAAESAVSVPIIGKRVLFLGNSITQNGLYVSMVEYWLRKNNPEEEYDLLSVGLGSETVSCLTEPVHPYPRPCLEERLERILTAVKPDVVLACYGMNDGIYHPQSPERLAAYQNGIRALENRLKRDSVPLLVLTPPVFDSLQVEDKSVGLDTDLYGYASPYQGYDLVLKDYADWLQEAYGPAAIDLHGPMKTFIQQQRANDPSFTLAPDGVHPQALGHWIMAASILKGLDQEVPEDYLTTLAEIQVDPLFELVHQKRDQRSNGWLKSIGYIRGDTVQEGTAAEVEQQLESMEREID
ncbi:MAG: SGNH/GDSL hydrolase family protein [Bacteroidota bacterium]